MPRDLTKLPGSIALCGEVSIEAAASDKGTPKFTMLAYTGGKMNVAMFDLPVVVDLEGMDIPSQNIPMRLQHDPDKGVGHSTKIDITGGQLTASGLISRDTQWARDVANSGKNGFPWQASIGAPVYKYEYLQPDQTAIVNGQEINGECYIVRASTLKEISFVDSGADGATEASITAKSTHSGEHETMKKTDKEIKACDCADGSTCDKCKTPKTKEVQAKAVEPKTVEASGVAEQIKADRLVRSAEIQRVADIQAMCKGQHPTIEAEAVRDGWDITKTELNVLQASRPKAPAGHVHTKDTSASTLEAAAVMSTGRIGSEVVEKMYSDKTLEAADKFRGIGIQELCELACGAQLPRFTRDGRAFLEAAFSSTSLPGILSNIANKTLLAGFNYGDKSWRDICKIASVNDFKEHTRYRLTNDFTFKKVGASGELKHGQLGEENFGNKVDTHGIMFSLTRQMIINDDLSAFTDLPWMIGMGANDAINGAVWPLLLKLVSAGFISAGKKNYKTGADTAFGMPSLSIARRTFLAQVKPGKKNKTPLGIPPKILLVPGALEDAAIDHMAAKEIIVTTAEGVAQPNHNTHRGRYKVVSTEQIGGEFLANGSDLAWYLLSDPRVMAALEVAFLGGKDTPTVERADADFDTLGVNFRGFIDFGTREQDHRAIVKMKGEV